MVESWELRVEGSGNWMAWYEPGTGCASAAIPYGAGMMLRRKKRWVGEVRSLVAEIGLPVPGMGAPRGCQAESFRLFLNWI